jgi:hypothetical protein
MEPKPADLERLRRALPWNVRARPIPGGVELRAFRPWAVLYLVGVASALASAWIPSDFDPRVVIIPWTVLLVLGLLRVMTLLEGTYTVFWRRLVLVAPDGRSYRDAARPTLTVDGREKPLDAVRAILLRPLRRHGAELLLATPGEHVRLGPFLRPEAAAELAAALAAIAGAHAPGIERPERREVDGDPYLRAIVARAPWAIVFLVVETAVVSALVLVSRDIVGPSLAICAIACAIVIALQLVMEAFVRRLRSAQLGMIDLS